MSGYHELLAEVEAVPRGRRTAAFFDFDGTLIDGYSAMAMMEHRARGRQLSPVEMARRRCRPSSRCARGGSHSGTST
jgi:hypothetical protein